MSSLKEMMLLVFSEISPEQNWKMEGWGFQNGTKIDSHNNRKKMKNTLFLSLLLLQILQFVASQESGSELHKCDGLFIPLNIKSHSFVTIYRYDFESPIVITSEWSTLNATSSMDPILFPVPTDGRKSGNIRVVKGGQEICSVEVNFLRPPPRDPKDITSLVFHKTTCCGFTR